MPPQAHGVKVISIGMFTAGNAAVVWRGPMLHRALQQFLADVYWGDLDVLLLDLPPGTGDIAISMAQLLPNAEILVVTTPQQAAAEVAERAGSIAVQTHQRVVGVVENMSWTGAARRLARGGLRHRRRADRGRLADPDSSARRCRCSGRSRWRPRVREGGDDGTPVVLTDPESPPRPRCWPWPRSSRCARAGWRACRWASPRSGAELAIGSRSRGRRAGGR